MRQLKEGGIRHKLAQRRMAHFACPRFGSEPRSAANVRSGAAALRHFSSSAGSATSRVRDVEFRASVACLPCFVLFFFSSTGRAGAVLYGIEILDQFSVPATSLHQDRLRMYTNFLAILHRASGCVVQHGSEERPKGRERERERTGNIQRTSDPQLQPSQDDLKSIALASGQPTNRRRANLFRLGLWPLFGGPVHTPFLSCACVEPF